MVARWQLGGKSRLALRPTVLVPAASVAAVLLTAAVLFGTRWTPSSDAQTWVSAGVRVVMSAMSDKGGGTPLATVPNPGDRLLGGLLSPDFDDSSCLSRYRASLYRQASLHALSPHLVSALRRYESLHRLCAPGTPAYARAIERRLRASPNNASAGDGGADPSGARCNYLVWTPNAGLGNRILSIASGFLYALLTDRVLLLHSGSRRDLEDLFCEPFPGSTWILPEKDLPVHEGLGIRTNESLGNTLRRGEALGGAPWLYVHLLHNYYDKLFFCDDVQAELARVPWLVFQADNYFAPALFLLPRHERELARMFPRRDAVFHHLGRYLFHPSNAVWGMVTRYHGSSYFAQADERVGIQVRVFKWAPISVDELYGQILKCAQQENVLPGVSVPTRANTTATVGSGTQQPAKRKAVVVVSLYNEYSEKLRELYHEHSGAADGEAVSVFQPTHLGEQRFGDRQQDQKALAEMVLLSFADVLVTTGVSTFGYVSQGIAGLRPWVLMPPNHGKAPDTPCQLAPTIEPCFHSPPNYDCRGKASGDTGRMVRHIRHCEDFPHGVQLLQS